MLEEPERGVHPRRLKQFVDLLFAITEEGSSTQILMSTHSPYLVDCFRDDLGSVLVFDKPDNNSGTTVSTAEAQLKSNGNFSDGPLGEVWYSGVLGGVPK